MKTISLALFFIFIGHAVFAQTPPVFLTAQQFTVSQQRNLEMSSLAFCTVPQVTITHTPGYVVPTAPPQTIYVNLYKYPHAACNDGTRAVFLFRQGYGVAASRWVIYLDGGGECNTSQGCLTRQSKVLHLISSEPYASGKTTIPPLSGILSPDPAQNPDFYDANLVQVSYCSSDYWSGEQVGNTSMSSYQIRASQNVSNWYFEGHGIVQGVVQLLQQKYGLNNASDVLLAGGSAGAVGAFLNANLVSGMLPLTTRFAVLPDSGYFMSNYPDYDSETGGDDPLPTNFQTVMTDGQTMWASVGDADCAWNDQQNGTGANNIQCDYPDQLLNSDGYQIPMFIRSSYQDSTILGTFNVTQPVTPKEQPYVTNFDDTAAAALGSVNPLNSVFGLNITTHTMIKDSDFTATAYPFPNGSSLTLADAVGIWYRNPCTAGSWLQPPD
jgi:hypothetical protein